MSDWDGPIPGAIREIPATSKLHRARSIEDWIDAILGGGGGGGGSFPTLDEPWAPGSMPFDYEHGDSWLPPNTPWILRYSEVDQLWSSFPVAIDPVTGQIRAFMFLTTLGVAIGWNDEDGITPTNSLVWITETGFHIGTPDGPSITLGLENPTVGAGVDLPLGSLRIRISATPAQLWFKYGNAATEWTALGGPAIPAGGVAGQALVKSSNADYTVTWADVEAGGGGGDPVDGGRFIDTIGDDETLVFEIDHDLGTTAVDVVVFRSTGEQVLVPNTRLGINTVELDFSGFPAPPTVDEYTVVVGIIGGGGGGGGGGSESLAGLTDVDVTTDTPDVDDFLAWDGTNWTPATISAMYSGILAAIIDNGTPGATGLALLLTANQGAARTAISAASTTHASSHADGGSDEISIDASQVTAGVLALARLGTGTPTATNYLRGDGTWATPAGGGGSVDEGDLLMKGQFFA